MMRALRAIAWYVTSLMGDRDYAHYLAYLQRTQPGAVPLSARAYWRARHAAADQHPGARCC